MFQLNVPLPLIISVKFQNNYNINLMDLSQPTLSSSQREVTRNLFSHT